MRPAPRSRAGLEEEVIPAYLEGLLVLIRRRGTDDEFRGEDLVPGLGRTRTNQDAVAGALESDQTAQAKGLGPISGELNAVSRFDGGHLRSTHDRDYGRKKCRKASTTAGPGTGW